MHNAHKESLIRIVGLILLNIMNIRKLWSLITDQQLPVPHSCPVKTWSIPA